MGELNKCSVNNLIGGYDELLDINQVFSLNTALFSENAS